MFLINHDIPNVNYGKSEKNCSPVIHIFRHRDIKMYGRMDVKFLFELH